MSGCFCGSDAEFTLMQLSRSKHSVGFNRLTTNASRQIAVAVGSRKIELLYLHLTTKT